MKNASRAKDPVVVDNEVVHLQQWLARPPANVVDIGCGTGDFMRKASRAWPGCVVQGVEADRRQVDCCMELDPGARITHGVAQSLPISDCCIELVVMMKSLHHVPAGDMDAALAEVSRVLVPGGHLYVSEPLFEGPFNDIVRLFHDEQQVRAQAQAALDRVVKGDHWVQEVDQVFMASLNFADYEDFERRIVRAPYENHRLSDATERAVRSRFAVHMGPQGAQFVRAVRARLLRKNADG